MQDSLELQQGDIVLFDLAPTKGHEQSGSRPAIIVSVNAINVRSYLKQIVPVASTHREYPMHLQIPEGDEAIHGDVLIDQVKTLDLMSRNYRKIGHLSEGRMNTIMNSLKLLFGF